VFSTAPPPAIAAAAREALRIVESEPERRARLQANVRRFARGAAQLGLRLGPPGVAAGDPDAVLTPIQPLVIGEDGAAMEISRSLFERGYWVAAIRPPTVPRGTARLRITLSAAHEEAQIDGLVEALAASLCAPSP
jgi:8-amino-7-oxononanoate synthase